MEYCSVVWHDNLTQAQEHSIERLKIILGTDSPRKDDGRFDYNMALVIGSHFSTGGRKEL